MRFNPPLAIHFIWNLSDNDTVNPVLETVSKYLSRDINRPFSRNLNVPVFFYSSNSPTVVPSGTPQELAVRNVVFVFTSVNTIGRPEWSTYINQLPFSDTMRIVPIALDVKGLGHGATAGSLKNLNFIRAYEWPKTSLTKKAIISIAHEIYRFGFAAIVEENPGKSSSITLFLSHAKSGDTGRLHAEEIKRYIDTTNMSRFFDAQEIAPAFKFDEEIIKHIEKSTMVAISSDDYSSRYWCQREILCAKEKHRPIIAVDCLEDYEDRIFPAGSNVPCVHVSPETPLKEDDILRILTAALLETIRHHHAIASLEYYREQGWIDSDSAVCSRPPEIRHLLDLIAKGKNRICYPEPPIYSNEADWHTGMRVDAFTPLWNREEESLLKDFPIGISISDVLNDGYRENHLPADQLTRLAQDLARHLLARSATLIYGGDLRKDGFTEFILEEAVALKSRLDTDEAHPVEIHVENHLVWPLYRKDLELVAWRGTFSSVMSSIEHSIPVDVAAEVDEHAYLEPSSAKNLYIWSRCLTEMRLKSVEKSRARICAGGKLSGYKGKMPGVLEEILIAIDKKKPIYLLGGFGGVVGEVCKVFRGEAYPSSLTEDWQVTHNDGYIDLQTIARTHGKQADYDRVELFLKDVNLSELSKNSGLDEDNYVRLMSTPFVDECVHIVMSGLKKLCKT